MNKKFMKSVVSLSMAAMMLTTPVSALASSKAYLMKTKVDDIRLREADGDIITTLDKGTKVLYWGKHEGDMYKVVTTGGKVGYVYKEYLRSYGVFKKSQVYRAEEKIKLYKRSGSSLKSNGTLKKGQYCVVYKTSGRWAYIKTMSGKTAYCLREDLEKAF